MPERTTPGMNVALTIAGSDPSGGAGIQADLKTFAVLGVFGASAITAITVQNTNAVKHVEPMSPKLITDQVAAVASDIEIDAVKTGMLPNAKAVKAVAEAIKNSNLTPLVVDPVMVSTTGDTLADQGAVDALGELLSLAAITTPNAAEAAHLLGHPSPPEDPATAATAAKQICDKFGVKACVVTGLRKPGDGIDEAVDVFYDGQDIHELGTDWRDTPNLHGSGCTFSAAITASLANGQTLADAVHTAKSVVAEAIRQTTDLGHGNAPVNHIAYMQVANK